MKVFVLMAAGICSLSAANPFGFAINMGGPVESVNLATNADASAGSFGFATDSLAADPSGNLYSADSSGMLWKLTGSGPAPIGPTGLTGIADLDYANGGFWGFSNPSQSLFYFDLGSSSITVMTPLAGLGPVSVTGVAYRPSDGSVFLSGYAGFNNDALFQVLPNASSAMAIGALANGDSGSYISDIDFDPATGKLYAMTWYHRWFYEVNPGNASSSLVSTGPHRDVTGLALPAVPEPLTVLTLVVAIAGWRMNRRRS